MNKSNDVIANPYQLAFKGVFSGILQWPQLTRLWEKVRNDRPDSWYVYAIGEAPPTEPADAGQLERFIDEIDALLRREHCDQHCGIVYADNRADPSFIKIYDPNNLGAVCGAGGQKILPGWTLSRLPPIDLPTALAPPMNRQRWWRRLFAN